MTADIYSLGVLIFHLVSGAYPVEGRTKNKILEAHQRHERRRLRDLRPDLPDAFVRVVERALAEDPKARYQTAGAFADELAAALGFLHTPARESDSSQKTTVARSGRRARYWAAAVVVLLIGAIGVWSYWSAAGPGRIAQQDVTVAKDTSSTLPDATVLDPATYQIGARFHVMKASKETTLKAGDRVAPGDRLFVTVESSKPVHVYVINEDEHGESYLLFPLPGQNLANPLPGGLRNRLPGVTGGEEVFWKVTSIGGKEHFYIFASRSPLEQFEQSLAALSRPRLDQTVQSILLPKNVVGVLRGVGGLAKAEPTATAGTTTDFSFATPLLETPETARGFWAREIVFANPAK